MSSSVLSIDSEPAYSEFIWRWLHHSDDKERIGAMVGCYGDESEVSGSGPSSAMGAVLLDSPGYDALQAEWSKALSKHGVAERQGAVYISMKDFGKDGELSHWKPDRIRPLLADLVGIINSRKKVSIGSTLTPEHYRKHLTSFLSKNENLTIHSLCFLQLAIRQAAWAIEHGHTHDIPFMFDQGCPDRPDVDAAHGYVINFQSPAPLRIGTIAWADDKKFPALQAADTIAWAVRRRAAGMMFKNGYEPLEQIFDGLHKEADFNESLLAQVGAGLRVKLKR